MKEVRRCARASYFAWQATTVQPPKITDARLSILHLRKTWLALGLVGVFFLAWAAVWQRVSDRVSSGERYTLRPEQIEITPPPPWIQADVKAEALRNASLDRPLSILDDEATRRIYEAFPLHPWVRQVERVTRQPGPRVKVDLVYRRPACMVQLPADLTSDASPGEILVYAVDEEGVLLPSADFSPALAGRYPLLVRVRTLPGQVGETWGDDVVHGGARVAAALSEQWNELRLVRIAPENSAASADSPLELRFTLTAENGVEVLWGAAPQWTEAGQAIVQQKLAELMKHRAADGALQPLDGAATIDLRRMDEAEAAN